MRKFPIMWLLMTIIMLTGCGQSRIEDLAKDIDRTNQIEKQEKHTLLPSNKEQNRQKNHVDPQIQSYADEYGYQLDQMYLMLLDMKPLFYSEQVKQEDLNNAKDKVKQIQELSKKMQEMPPSIEFKDLYLTHVPLDIELNSLHLSLEDFDINNEVHFRRARLYYEAVVTTQKLLEAEYLIILEELGIK